MNPPMHHGVSRSRSLLGRRAAVRVLGVGIALDPAAAEVFVLLRPYFPHETEASAFLVSAWAALPTGPPERLEPAALDRAETLKPHDALQYRSQECAATSI